MMRIVEQVAAHDRGRLRLTYAGGESVEVDLSPMILAGGIFARFADPGFFAQARVGERCRSVEWPDDIDLCADALWLDAQEQSGRQAA